VPALRTCGKQGFEQALGDAVLRGVAVGGGVTVANVASTVAGFGLVILEGFAQVPFLPYHIMGGTIADLVALALFVP